MLHRSVKIGYLLSKGIAECKHFPIANRFLTILLGRSNANDDEEIFTIVLNIFVLCRGSIIRNLEE